jgi:hypothetical protein
MAGKGLYYGPEDFIVFRVPVDIELNLKMNRPPDGRQIQNGNTTHEAAVSSPSKRQCIILSRRAQA